MWKMKTSLLLQGILLEEKDALVSNLTLWNNLKIWRVAGKKFKGMFSDQDEINVMLEEGKTQYQRRGLPRLRATILFQLANHLEIETTKIKTYSELIDLSTAVENASINMLRITSKGKFKGNSIEGLIKFNLEQMFKDLSKTFGKKSADEQDELVKNMMQVIAEMPDDQKNKLREELGVDDLTESTVRTAIITGTLGIAFAAVVEVAGFSAYIFAVKALAAIAGLVGLTLPFAAYSTLTSMMAAFANPYLIIPMVLGLGVFMTKKANKKIRNALVPTIVSQCALSGAKGDVDDKEIQRTINSFNELIHDS
jgi:hypothetical protein